MAKENETDLKAVVAQVLKEILPATISAAATGISKAQSAAKLEADEKHRASLPTGERCRECRQTLKPGVTSETHPHRQVVAFPTNTRLAQWWQGYGLNGVIYNSGRPGHKVTVPANCNIEEVIQAFERQELETETGRVANHNSGHISNPQIAQKAWR